MDWQPYGSGLERINLEERNDRSEHVEEQFVETAVSCQFRMETGSKEIILFSKDDALVQSREDLVLSPYLVDHWSPYEDTRITAESYYLNLFLE